jgi:hypothetical protein
MQAAKAPAKVEEDDDDEDDDEDDDDEVRPWVPAYAVLGTRHNVVCHAACEFSTAAPFLKGMRMRGTRVRARMRAMALMVSWGTLIWGRCTASLSL